MQPRLHRRSDPFSEIYMIVSSPTPQKVKNNTPMA